MNANEKAVAEVLAKYQDALNGSDTAAVMRLYADDGVFMPPYSQLARPRCGRPTTRCSMPSS
jgi:ketosteroid isomerase-like protein